MILAGEQPSTRRENCLHVTLWISTWVSPEFYRNFHGDRTSANCLLYETAQIVWQFRHTSWETKEGDEIAFFS